MKFHKRSFLTGQGILVATAALLAAFALPAMADDVGSVSTSSTNRFIANATVTANMGVAVKIDKQSKAGLLVKFQGDAAGTSNIVVTIARSADGLVWETTPPAAMQFSTALNGTTAVVGYHQIPDTAIGSAHSIKVLSVQNPHATVNATNASIAIVKKVER